MTDSLPASDVGAAKNLAAILTRYRGEGVFTHAYAAVGKLTAPVATHVESCLPDGRDVFDLASLTKALVTTPLVFAGIRQGEITLATTVGAWLGPDKAAPLALRLQQLTVGELLAHVTGLPAWRNFWIGHLGLEPQERLAVASRRHFRLIEGLGRAAVDQRPDRRSVYSDVGFLLLGLCLELTKGVDLAAAFEQFCSAELGLTAADLPLGYASRLSIAKRAVPTAFCPLRGRQLVGEVHDENCASFGGVAGHAGLFGSGPALSVFLHKLAASPTGRLLLNANAAARKLPPGDPPNEALLGWRQGADPGARPFGDGAAMGHLGFTGVAFWVCPETGAYAILLTNRVAAGRTRPGIAAFRREALGALWALRP